MATTRFKELQKKLYESYKANMKFYGKEKDILPFRKWVKEVNNINNIK